MSIKKFAALLLTGALCLSALTGCGAKPEETVATLAEENVNFGVANFLFKYQKATVDDMYALYGMTWDTDLYGFGTTLEDDFKDSAVQLLHDLYTLKQHMADYNVEITAEEEAAITAAATAFMEGNSPEAIEEFGATQEIVEEVLTLYTIQAKVYKEIIAGADRNVSDEEANMRGYSMVSINLAGSYDESYNYVEYTETEVAVLKESAKELVERISNGLTLEEAAEELEFDVTTSAYAKEDTSLNADLLAAMDALNEGETSGLIETTSNLYIVRIDTDTDVDATEANRVNIIANREAALYEEVVTTWQENDDWTVNESVIDKIDFHNWFTQMETSAESE